MKLTFYGIKITPKNRLVPAVVGQPNNHIMDWRGCNFRLLTLPGWRRGKTLENTKENRFLLQALLDSLDKEKVINEIRYYQGAGIGEYNYPFIDLTKEERQEYNRQNINLTLLEGYYDGSMSMEKEKV